MLIPGEGEEFAPSVAASGVSFPWYALRVRSNFEKKASVALRQKGFEEFAPFYRTRSYWSDRVKLVDRPLFPGYVFCRFDPQRWLPVLQTPGVIEAVGIGTDPAPVEESEIASIRAMVTSPVSVFPTAFLKVGQRVLIQSGPLAGLEGILQKFEKDCRIVVSVNLLQRSVAAVLDAEWVTSVR